MGLVSLTTDFGSRDWFVGTMKGVILEIAPEARIVDLTHDLPAGEIHQAAFALAAACRYFPVGTVHVVVVDPGVGSERAAIAVKTEGSTFVGPDNGVLSLALAGEKILEIRQITNSKWFLEPVSHTFHGRDIFAPVGAHLSREEPMESLGPALPDYHRLEWPQPRRAPGVAQGEVVYLDRFGNAITNIPSDWVSVVHPDRVFLTVGDRKTAGLRSYYQAIPANQLGGILGSTGYLEIAMNGHSAAERFDLKPGQKITLRFTAHRAGGGAPR